MTNIAVNTLNDGQSFKDDLLLDKTFILLPQSAVVTEELINALKTWEFTEVMTDRNLSIGTKYNSASDFDDEKKNEKPEEKIGGKIKEALENSKSNKLDGSDETRMSVVSKIYNEYLNYIENIYTHYATHRRIDIEDLTETVQELIVFIRENRRYILRINPDEEMNKKNFLVIHSMRTTVLAIAIAMQMRMPLSKMIELGTTSILHEIGMLRLPPQIYMSDKKLTTGEQLQIKTHSVLGYVIVKDLNFPLPVQLGILEHHEKENGTGYPRHLNGDKISSIAKIISVACSFEAITSARKYKNEKSTFEAIVELLQNREHQYDDVVIKALLFSVSLYPIGSYVYLQNGKPAFVTDTNPSSPKYPVLQLALEINEDGTPIICQSDEDQNKILRLMTKEEKTEILQKRKKIFEEFSKRKTNFQSENTKDLKTESKNSDKTENTTEEVDLSEFGL